MDEGAEDLDGYADRLLETELALFSSTPAFVGGVRDALGADPSVPLEGDSGVVAHLLQVTNSVLAAYLLTPGGLIVFECAPNGTTLCVAIPAFRLSRVEVRGFPDGSVRAAFEVDGDVATTRWSQDGAGVTARAAYVVDGEGESAEAVRNFATEVRCLLVGL